MIDDFVKTFFKTHLSPQEEILLIFRPNVKQFLNDQKNLIIFGQVVPLIGLILTAGYIFMTYIFLTWLVLGIFRMLYIYYIWLRDVWLLTDKSLVKVSWAGPYRQDTSRVEFPDIAEFGYTKSGIVQHFTKVGNIQVELNNGTIIVFESQLYPEKKVELLSKIRLEFLRTNRWADENTMKEILSTMITEYLYQMGAPAKNEKRHGADNEEIVIDVIERKKWKI